MYSFLKICYNIGNMFYGVTDGASADGITHIALYRNFDY